MGSFYGSVHVRGDDRAAVLAVVAELARKGKGRFLVGPPLGGWIGVYPDGHGQDSRVVSALAKRLPGELVGVLVHDDDIFAYDYYRDGRLVDRYNSRPDYFGDVSQRERASLRGRRERLEHLAADPAAFAALREALAGADAVVFASELLNSFAKALGVSNALTSYEYLREGETDNVANWDEFVHVPDLSHEQAEHRRAEQALVETKRQLARQDLLLADLAGHKGDSAFTAPVPRLCAAPVGRGFLVTWTCPADPTEGPRPLERYGPPWSAGAARTVWSVAAHVCSLALSPSGRYLAVGHGAGDWKAELWDLNGSRRVCEVPHVRAVQWVGFLPDESAMVSVSTGAGGIVVSPVHGGRSRTIAAPAAAAAAAHPDGRQLVLGDERGRLLLFDLAEGRIERTLFVGGRQDTAEELRAWTASIRAASELNEWNMEHLERELRDDREAMLSQLASPEWAAEAAVGADDVYCLAFDPAGERLFAATMNGVRVYAWAQAIHAEDSTPPPLCQVNVAGEDGQVARRNLSWPGNVDDLAFDPHREWLIFGARSGCVYYLDVAIGRSGVLLDPPGRPGISRVALSRDRSALALVCEHDVKGRRGPSVQFWDYPALCPVK